MRNIKMLSFSIALGLFVNSVAAEEQISSSDEADINVNQVATPSPSAQQENQLEVIDKKVEKNSDNISNMDQTMQRVEQKIDVIDVKVTATKAALIDQPLGNRTHGIEFNPFRVLTWNLGDESTFSAGYSWFDTDNNVEIAVPVFYGKANNNDYDTSSLSSVNLDVHYRKYLGHRLDGFYLSGFARYTHLSGTQENSDYTYSEGSEDKFGVGVGIGYRIISTTGIYWGCGLSFGRYIVGEAEQFVNYSGVSTALDDSDYILDIEFLKFGYAF